MESDDALQPKTLKIAECFHFYVNGIKGEVNDYFAKLRRMALTCEFENFLYEAFCSCFMCRLLGEKFNADFFQK